MSAVVAEVCLSTSKRAREESLRTGIPIDFLAMNTVTHLLDCLINVVFDSDVPMADLNRLLAAHFTDFSTRTKKWHGVDVSITIRVGGSDAQYPT